MMMLNMMRTIGHLGGTCLTSFSRTQRKEKTRIEKETKSKSCLSKVEESLTGRVIAAHGDIVRKLHNVEEAQRARDAFTKVSKLDHENSKKNAPLR